jgi:hypothetical protein
MNTSTAKKHRLIVDVDADELARIEEERVRIRRDESLRLGRAATMRRLAFQALRLAGKANGR